MSSVVILLGCLPVVVLRSGASRTSPKEPNNKPYGFCEKTTEQNCSEHDLPAHCVEDVHALLDLFELGFTGHLILGLQQ